jgi:hypothetical protein
MCLDRLEQRRQVFACRNQLDVGLGLEQAPDALAHEVRVLRDDNADHRARL